MIRFWFSVLALLLMLAYQTVLSALATHVPGFDLPPGAVFVLSIVSLPLLLAANAMPFLLKTLPGEADATLPVPMPTQASGSGVAIAVNAAPAAPERG